MSHPVCWRFAGVLGCCASGREWCSVEKRTGWTAYDYCAKPCGLANLSKLCTTSFQKAADMIEAVRNRFFLSLVVDDLFEMIYLCCAVCIVMPRPCLSCLRSLHCARPFRCCSAWHHCSGFGCQNPGQTRRVTAVYVDGNSRWILRVILAADRSPIGRGMH